MIQFFETLFYAPKSKHFLVSFLLLPFAFLYGAINFFRVLLSTPKDYGIKIISIGNITVGGTGKTPFAIALIEYLLEKKPHLQITYISRGYGRKSKGLVEVKKDGKILCSVEQSGDEAMLVAKESRCDVIVSEDRGKAIQKAKKDGANLIILDDGFSKVAIKKFDILLMPQTINNPLPLPAGPFREFLFMKKRANLILQEEKDYKRVVTCDNCEGELLLVTAIANPKRLEKFLPKNIVGQYILSDHSFFTKEKILAEMKKRAATKILTTQKDFVKLESFKLPIALLKLKLQINLEKLKQIERYIDEK